MRTNDNVDSVEEETTKHLDTSSINDMTLYIRQFAIERNWSKYHTPRSILLATMGELGELAEIFQWKGDSDTPEELMKTLSRDDLDHIEQEFADVCIYLLRLSDICNINLGLVTKEYGQKQLVTLLEK